MARRLERIDALDQILDLVTDGFVALDRAWRFTYVNRNAARMLGRDAAQLVGACVHEEFPESIGNPFHRAQERALATQEPVFVEAYLEAWDRWFENRIYPSANGLTIFFTDVTEGRRAEAERDRLLASERKARAEAEAAVEKLHAIQAITDSALLHLGLDEMLRELLTRLRRALEADTAGVFLLDEERKMLYPRAVDGPAASSITSLRIPVGRAFTGRIVAEGRPLIVNDSSTLDLSGLEGPPAPEIMALARSMVGAPLRVGDKVIGAAVVTSARPGRFTPEDLDMILLVADRAAPAVERARLMETVRAGGERLKLLSRRLLTAHEEERRRLAVELHDELGQVLTAVKINLETLEQRSGATPAPVLLKDAIGSVDRAMEKVHDIALDLRPSVLDDLGLPAALRWYVDRFARAAGVEVKLSIDAVPDVDAEIETACFRLAQEALTNVVRHARARHLSLELRLLADGLELLIWDDGVGFDVAAARERASSGLSLGLLGMEERVALAGGEHELLSKPGTGTLVRARFPLGERARDRA